ncbi:MAG: valine--tRNA ligase [Dehalococcoidia bacterium]|nr:valine--tRNA ligase [Dehalococcoidia bacterium]
MLTELPKAYQPGEIEKKWYEFWLSQGYFTPKIDHSKKPFVIIMPPPNVTGELHMGHALTITLEDTMVRWHRMRGEPTLWLPGTDHAGIATQVVVEQQLAKQGLTRNDIGLEKFLETAWEWTNKRRQGIQQQHRMLGASCDWTRERFTLDESPSRAVRTAFVNLYNKGLIYRGKRMINWCPRCQTSLSDLEVKHRDITGTLYYIRYPLADQMGFITVATTRPETLPGDSAVAVNPEDTRYVHLVGKKVTLPLTCKKIPIIADAAVDTSFGTGALKITPAHDPIDFEVAQRHGLPTVDTMNDDGSMNKNAGPYRDLDRFTCREKILVDLKKAGLLEKTEVYSSSVGYCNRCQTMIEPKISLQWFVNTKTMSKAAIEAVTEGNITIIPGRFTKVYLDWMENIKDWCISRQLWWGHRIPVWYCHNCGKLTVSVDTPRNCKYCASRQIKQDPDVLDTWFSSALWTHSTLGWPENTDDFQYFYPTSVIETGYDILFFWIARMVMMGLEDTGKIPFHTIYLHGLLRDEQGDKMSKLKGNVVNPITAVAEYGIDALRFALVTGSAPGNDVKLSTGKLKSSRNFVNKLWNTARFIMQIMDREKPENLMLSRETNFTASSRIEDRWIYSQLNRLTDNVAKLMENFQFGEAAQQIYDFIWTEFCDWYIEIAKIRFRDSQSPSSPLPILLHTLETTLRLLHPFMPFVTEEIWQNLKHGLPLHQQQMPESIMIAPYPTINDKIIDPNAEKTMTSIVDIIRSIRNARAQYKVISSQWIEAQIYSDELIPYINSQSQVIQKLARVHPLTILSKKRRKKTDSQSLVLVLHNAEVVLPWAGLIDISKEKQRLGNEIIASIAMINKIRSRLSDNAFLTKAPAHVIRNEQEKLHTLEDKTERLNSELSQLS